MKRETIEDLRRLRCRLYAPWSEIYFSARFSDYIIVPNVSQNNRVMQGLVQFIHLNARSPAGSIAGLIFITIFPDGNFFICSFSHITSKMASFPTCSMSELSWSCGLLTWHLPGVSDFVMITDRLHNFPEYCRSGKENGGQLSAITRNNRLE